MRLLSQAQEAALTRKVKASHDELVRGLVSGDLPEVSFALGALSVADPDSGSHLTIWQVRRLIKAGSHLVDAAAADAARDRLVDAVKSARDRLLTRVRGALRDGSALLRRRKLSKRDMAKARRAAIVVAKEQVEKALEIAEREWQRDVALSIHDAMEEGRAATIVKSFGGGDAAVYKKVQEDCCKYCRLLYTVDGVRPRLFRLDDLVSNGSNVGRRAGRPTLKGLGATEWLPVIGSVHPGCRCELRAIPGRLAKTSKKG